MRWPDSGGRRSGSPVQWSSAERYSDEII